MEQYVAPQPVSLRKHPDYNEKWVQQLIADNPGILGLGPLDLIEQERILPGGGRLDLVLQGKDTTQRYEVELQLGPLDESHIIRTIEYWDIERKQHRQFQHCAVIIAESITSRFFNIISLFNGAIPLIAIQVQAYKVGENFTLIFTTILDMLRTSSDDEVRAPANRPYWEKRATKETVAIADQLLAIAKEFDSKLDFRFNNAYIGITKDEKAFNFITFAPQVKACKLSVKIPYSEDLENEMKAGDLDVQPYDKTFGYFNIRIGAGDVSAHKESLRKIMEQAYELFKN